MAHGSGAKGGGWWGGGALSVAALLAACSSAPELEGPQALASSPAGEPCIDEDGDGFGQGCARGDDCDDTEPVVTNQCYVGCAEPLPGCPCEEEGQRLFCSYAVSSARGQKECGPGYSTCEQGFFGPCILNNTAAPPTD